jgi:hypothetical protein
VRTWFRRRGNYHFGDLRIRRENLVPFRESAARPGVTGVLQDDNRSVVIGKQLALIAARPFKMHVNLLAEQFPDMFGSFIVIVHLFSGSVPLWNWLE